MFRRIIVVTLAMVVAAAAVASDSPSELWTCWRVKRALATTNISGLSQQDTERIINTEVYYSAQCAKSGRTTLKSPGYVTKTLSEREFFEYANIPLKQLDIAGTTVTMITLSAAEGLHTRFVGSTVFLGAKNPIVEVEGVFFELQKDEQKRPSCDCR